MTPVPVAGDCRVSWWEDPATRRRVLRLDKADADIQISGELLAQINDRGWLGEGVFIIVADNATARYGLGERDPETDIWTARRIGPDPLRSA